MSGHAPFYVPSSIVSVPAGTFTPGALASLEFAATLINKSWDKANEKAYYFEQKIDDIGLWLPTAGDPHIGSVSDIPVIAVNEPVVNIPSNVDTSMIMTDYETEYAKGFADLTAKATYIISTYFPNDQANFDAAEQWLSDALASTTGLPAAVAAQIEADDHARITREFNRASDTATAKMAGMRFPMPAGAMASFQLQLAQKKQDAMAESSRKLTMMSVEQLKWVVEKVLNLRQMAIGSALEYVKSLIPAMSNSAQVVGLGIDANSKLISAASSFYNARTEAQKAISSSYQYNTGKTLTIAEKNQMVDLTLIKNKLEALMAECAAFAQMATSMFNNLHAAAGTSYGVNGT